MNQQLCICSYVFLMILTVHTDHFAKQGLPTDLRSVYFEVRTEFLNI
jgi:hypothetical protein